MLHAFWRTLTCYNWCLGLRYPESDTLALLLLIDKVCNILQRNAKFCCTLLVRFGSGRQITCKSCLQRMGRGGEKDVSYWSLKEQLPLNMPKKLSTHSSSAKVFSLSTFDYTPEYFLLDLMCNWEQLAVCFYFFEVSCELFCSLWLHL